MALARRQLVAAAVQAVLLILIPRVQFGLQVVAGQPQVLAVLVLQHIVAAMVLTVTALKAAVVGAPLVMLVTEVRVVAQMRLVLVALAVLVVAVVEALYLVSLARGAAEALVVAV